jgi:hypothetical protein
MLKKSLFLSAQPQRAETRLFPCGVLASLRGSEALEGIFRSPRSISKGERPHKVRMVPPRLFSRCGLARGTARLGAPGMGG